MKTTQENNKLIAEFMGFRPVRCKNGFAWDNNKIIKPISLHGNLVDTGNNGKFHSSWDWLMSVVEKISDRFGEAPKFKEIYIKWLDETEGNDFLIFRYSKEETYKAVVQFIEWHNEQNKTN